MTQLPTIDKMFAHAVAELDVAYKALGDAADWLRSDWRPMGASLTGVQSDARTKMFDAIGAAKKQINRAKNAHDKTRRNP